MSIFQQQILPVRDKLYRFALRITGSVHEAEDVVQDVLTKAWATAEKEQETAIQNWEAWCMTLTRNRSLDRNRSRDLRRTAPLEGVSESKSNDDSPARLTESNDTTDFIKNLMKQLPEKQRLVMHLRDIEEMNYEEIGETLDITLDQVKVNLHRARKTMREKILALQTTHSLRQN